MTDGTRVTEAGQVTIPEEFREKYDLEPGDELVWIDIDDGIVVRKRTLTAGRGLLVPDDLSGEKREDIAAELERRLRHRRERTDENE